ncbi:MAG: hypothetical protein K2X77_08395 [Candidatus Obscuribacterales bacterium]|nr:hypothetical protein [Candidatus Obscuribacterales bacterium]
MSKIRFQVSFSLILCLALSTAPTQAREKHLFLDSRPKLRKIVKAAGFGIITGGLSAPLLGHSVASGSLLGAGKGAAWQAWKQKRADRRQKQRNIHR